MDTADTNPSAEKSARQTSAPTSGPDASQLASDPRRSAWVAANAGAGKTYTLAARVTRLLLAGVRPERILCLTYTKAAAAEMSTRLFAQLGEWAMLDDATLRDKISALGETAGDREALRRARRLFAAALETPGGLKIQTIHAFCQQVLTRFPLEAQVPADFTVLDDRTGRDLMAAARARVFERAGRGDVKIASAISYLVTHLGDASLEQLMDNALGTDRSRISAFLDQVPEEDRHAALLTAHGAEPDDSIEKVQLFMDREMVHHMGTLQEACAWLAGGSKTDQARADSLQKLIEAPDAAARYQALKDTLLTASGEKRKRLATKKLAEARPDLLELLENLATDLLSAEDRMKAVHGALLCESALALITEVREIYAAEKRARAALDYDDLIAKTHALLADGGAGWVLYKLDEGIDHVLIDEAQDTSAAQWDIVQSLTEEFFADTGAGSRKRTIFAVGDEKQSIYSFQGADPRQFAWRRDFFKKQAQAAGAPFRNIDLPVSRRSATEILQFVDQTFAPDAARDGLTSGPDPVHHEAFRTELKGKVEFWPAIAPEAGEEADLWDLRPLDLESEASPIMRLASQITQKISGWLKAGLRLPGHDQPVAPGDIMILLPRREPFASAIIRKLKEAGVPVAGADRLKLAEDIAVMDLISLGQFVLAPGDDLALAEVLRSPLIGISEAELYTLAHGRPKTLWSSLHHHREEPAFQKAYGYIRAAMARADEMPPYEFYAAALRDDPTALARRLGPETHDAVQEFLSLALSFEQTGTPSLQGFLSWFDAGGAEVKRDMDRSHGEVRVMTVHGAKGLEADIVILPDTTTVPDGRADTGHFLYTGEGLVYPLAQKDAPEAVQKVKAARREEMMRERRRLLYVALTRACERLYICGFENKRGRQDGSWNDLCEQAMYRLNHPQKTNDDSIDITDGLEKILNDTPEIISYGKDYSQAAGPACADTAEAEKILTKKVEIPAWARTNPPEESPRPWLIRPSQAAGKEDPAPGSPLPVDDPVRRGILAHALLAHLPDITPEKRPALARQFLTRRGLSAEEADGLSATLLKVLDDPAFAAAFAPGGRSEVSLIADLPELGPNARVHGRIDRMLADESRVLIIDYKTNRRPAQRPESVPHLYLTQMALYRLAAQKIFPGRTVSCALLWTAGPDLMALPAALLDQETDLIRARLAEGPTSPDHQGDRPLDPGRSAT